ncbi:hypothetical protein [Paraburkholderia tropica]|uniref:hypothetical protein n=1 Tax=Paraburkholderia tropica TaxID=92647 RepID=UPI002AB0578C|nr:hypothetical protein [Paraburkholderia tropica]
MANDVVTINVSTQFAPVADGLQKTGTLVTQGGTTLTPGTKQLITEPSDLTPLLAGALQVTAATWATGTVTVTTASAHGITVGETANWTMAGFVPTGYNGTFQVTATTSTQFTYAVAVNPGTATTMGTVINASVAEVTAMVSTYFAQGSNNSVYVLELGGNTAAEGVTALTAYMVEYPNDAYICVVPRAWATESSYVALVSTYSGNTAMTYFFTTFNSTNAASASAYLGMKSFFGFVEDPSTPVTEFTVAFVAYNILNRSPSNVNKVPPTQYMFGSGVTNGTWKSAQKTQFKSLNLNYVIKGSEGGLTNSILMGGVLGSGIFFNFWYATDWAIINLHLNLANEVMNGSNSTINPLYYNQQGINRLQARAQKTVNSGIAFGLFLAPAVVNAVDFVTYTTDNPSDYQAGEYDGLSASLTPQNGFTHVVFNLNVTDLIG